ncbi:chemotaxis protein CheA [Thiomonas sp. FB-Cd]|uniref:chemotaxis protein CheA n=1 Tax=Thiomonas sp. FB-Cd TaxID=1158292 RepID=UPI000AD25B3A|nr:chemotaxis protein CheA [Thiomonas sp. FB-Cd]
MAMDNDILQEFLAESRELLADAQGQLLRLEADPTDSAVLGAIFRAFHTLKGGAGFLEAQNMVEWCHHLEDLLDKLRANKFTADSGMIDAILRSTDMIERMLDEMAHGENPTPGHAELGAVVQAYARGEQPTLPSPLQLDGAGQTWAESRTDAAGQTGLYVEKKPVHAPPLTTESAGEDDLEALFNQTLDALYGKDGAPGGGASPPAPVGAVSAPAANHAPTVPAAQSSEPQSREDTTIRVDSSRLDQAMNQVGELVLLRNRLSAAVARFAQSDDALVRMVRETDLAVNDLQNTVMRLRMQPCKRLFQSLPRVVRDASRSLGKKVRLELGGEDVEIDKTVIDALSGPLIHLVRNALDHGLEAPQDRLSTAKPEEGLLKVLAIHLGDKVQIQVSDDGRGMNPHKILQSALGKGIISETDAARLSEREMLDLIFLPGFSTKEQVSELSGRGVGMDVVRSAVQSLRGRVDITTRPNQGTTLTLELPLTLAVLPVLYFKLRRETYALPVSVVDNLMEIEPQQVHSISGRLMAQVANDRIVPYIDLGQQLQGSPLNLGKDPCEGILTEQGLLVVSEAVGTEDSVVKPLDISAQSSWYQGATISGGGDVVLILDIQALARAMRTTPTAQ